MDKTEEKETTKQDDSKDAEKYRLWQAQRIIEMYYLNEKISNNNRQAFKELKKGLKIKLNLVAK